MRYVDLAVATVLRTKFALGLFESAYHGGWPAGMLMLIGLPLYTDPYPYEDYLSMLRTPATRELLHQMEQEQIVLLQNNNNTLPLSKNIGSIALIGPQVNRVTVRLCAFPEIVC